MIDAIIESLHAQRITEMYQEYTSEAFYAICAALDVKLTRRFIDVVHPKPVDNRSGLEIAKDMLDEFGLNEVI